MLARGMKAAVRSCATQTQLLTFRRSGRVGNQGRCCDLIRLKSCCAKSGCGGSYGVRRKTRHGYTGCNAGFATGGTRLTDRVSRMAGPQKSRLSAQKTPGRRAPAFAGRRHRPLNSPRARCASVLHPSAGIGPRRREHASVRVWMLQAASLGNAASRSTNGSRTTPRRGGHRPARGKRG